MNDEELRSAYSTAAGMIRQTAAIGKAPMSVWAESGDHLLKEKKATLAAAVAFVCADYHAVVKAMDYRAPRVVDRIRERVELFLDDNVNLDADLAMVQIESIIRDYDQERP